jgi:preprotein translocase subunit SecG
MIILFTIVHVIVCLFLIIVVLLQSGKAADLAGAFGGMGSQTAFGPRGAATVLSKATTIAAGVFMVTSLSLSILYTREGSSRGGTSVLERTQAPAPAKSTAPAAPASAPKSPGTVQMEVEIPGQGKVKKDIQLPPQPTGQTPAQPAPKK